MSVISQFIDVVVSRLEAVKVDNGYFNDASQVIPLDRTTDWTIEDRTILVRAMDPEPEPLHDRPGNPPALGKRLPIRVSCIVFEDKKDKETYQRAATDFATDALRSIVSVPNWYRFDNRSINAEQGTITFEEPDSDIPAGASFLIFPIYRVSEYNPNQLRG